VVSAMLDPAFRAREMPPDLGHFMR
jgi:hypothetical protein